MQYRQHKDLTLSEIGLGCFGLGGAYGPKDTKSYKATLKRGFELGINLFDTAEAYGDAEQILGEVIQPFRQDVILSTKVGVRKGYQPDLSPGYVREACERSLQALGTDWIDLYHVHFDDPDTPVEDTVSTLEGLVQAGKIRHYGVGHLPAMRILKYIHFGDPITVMMELSPVTRAAKDEILPLCLAHDLAGIAFSVTGRGLLTGAIQADTEFAAGDIRSIDPLFHHASLQSGLNIARKLAELGSKHGRTPAQAAIAWVLAQPGVTCALTGPSKIAHLQENIGGTGWTFSAEELAEFESDLLVEESRLLAYQRQAVVDILTSPLRGHVEQAFIDLVYACENAVKLKMIAEQDLMPVFYELIAMRDAMDENTWANLVKIQIKLSDLIQSQDTPAANRRDNR